MRKIAPALFLIVGVWSSGSRADDSGPCRCASGAYEVALTIRVAESEIKESREEALKHAERLGALRLSFALAFCPPLPGGFRESEAGALSREGSECTATRRSPRPWPELIDLSCETSEIPPLPEGFALQAPTQWDSVGEELNRVYSKTLRMRREMKSCE